MDHISAVRRRDIARVSQSDLASTEYLEKVINRHKMAELAETRFNDAIDHVHLHPALAVASSETVKKVALSKEERARYQNYDVAILSSVIPDFWPPRVYDKPEQILSKGVSDTLYSENSKYSGKSTDIDFHFYGKIEYEDTLYFPPAQHSAPSPRVLTLPLVSFITESESETE